MRWTVHGERTVYTSDWMSLHLTDIELPDGRRFLHHVMRVPYPASGTVVHQPGRGVLLIWRHRFITDSWGWEVPAGRVEPGETPAEAAAREVIEETGWVPGPLRPLTDIHPMNGTSDARFHLFLADGATYQGEPVDAHEADRVEWVTDVRALLQQGQIRDGLSAVALLWAMAFGLIPGATA